MRFVPFAVAGVLLALAVVGSRARAGDPPSPQADEVAGLRAEVEALKAEVATLRRELAGVHARLAALEGKAPAPAPAPAPAMGEVPPAPSSSAPKSPPEALIDTYRAYSEAELQNPAHAVTPEMLLAIVGREDVEKDVRRKAAETIVLAPVVTNDPSFAMEGRGVARARVRFSSKVLTLLLDADPFVRGLAKSILEGLWGGWGSRIKEIRNCDPRDLDSCYKASKAWEEVFRS